VSESAAALCNHLGVASVTAFVESNSSRFVSEAKTCVAAALSAFHFADIPVGRFRAGLQITGELNLEAQSVDAPEPSTSEATDAGAPHSDASIPAAKAPTPYCVSILAGYSGATLAAFTRKQAPATFAIPAASPFTIDVGLPGIPQNVAASELGMLWQCESSPVTCRDGVDNDNDGATDCADAECVATCVASLAQTSADAGAGPP
jgi:hypothetical protein